MAITVSPDGPVPCDLAVVGEAPGREEIKAGRGFVGPSGRMLWGEGEKDLNLMWEIARRPRESCYVTNVCKEPMPDAEWWKLSQEQREGFEAQVRTELVGVQPRLVLAFGRRASVALVPGFGTMRDDHGKPTLGHGGHYIAMALWHPAAYLRGNREVLGDMVADLDKVQTILAFDGLAEFLRVKAEAKAGTLTTQSTLW